MQLIVGGETKKGSFDKSTQILTLYNSYLVDLVNQSSHDDSSKQLVLELIGSNDLIFDFSKVTTFPGTDILCCTGNITYNDSEISWMITMSGGTYSLVIGEGIFTVNDEGATLAFGVTIQELINTGSGIVDENVFTITGTQGNYDVTFT